MKREKVLQAVSRLDMISIGGESMYELASIKGDSMLAKEREKPLRFSTDHVVPSLVHRWLDIVFVFTHDEKRLQDPDREIPQAELW